MCAEVLRDRGWSVRKIAREIGFDESTLRYHLRKKQQGKVEDGRKNKPELCETWAEPIAVWMRAQAGLHRQDSLQSLYEQLVRDEGYTGSYNAVRRYVRHRMGVPARRARRRVETAPGAQGQADWAEHKVYLHDHGGNVKIYSFVLSLSWSRMYALIWSLRMDQVSWHRCHNEALRFLGGIPQMIRIDNLKTGVSRGSGVWGDLNQSYKSYADQVGFLIDPCRVRSPGDKGKVERRIRDQRLILPKGEHYADLNDLQEQTSRRVLERCRQLVCPVTGKSVYESWQDEQLRLQPLPWKLPSPFDCEVRRKVSRDCLVHFENHSYSVPFMYTGKTVSVRGCSEDVEIWHEGERLKTYPRHTECLQLIDQSCYEGESTEDVLAPVPLGEIGKEIVLQRSWEVPSRPIDRYSRYVEVSR